MKLGDQQPLFVPHASIAGTSNAGGAFAEVKLPEDYHYAYPVLNQVLTSIGNRPHYLFPGQWQADNDLNYDHSITNYVEAKDNAGSANWDFTDVNNVNNSLDAHRNDFRSNANGLQHQFGGTNPKTAPYIMYRELEPNGFTNAFNPIVPTATRISNSTSSGWSDEIYEAQGNALMRMLS